jgi:protocatechuate 3,4-dioxygenase beta subunit
MGSSSRLAAASIVACAALAAAAIWFVRRDAIAPAEIATSANARVDERELERVELTVESGRAGTVRLAEEEVPNGHGVLRLTVIAHADGAPVGDAPWQVVRANATRADLETSIAEFGRRSVRTDAQGHAEFTLPAGVEWKLLSGPPDDVEQLIPALAEREARELTLRIGPTADDWFVARVVDADTKRPIEGAQFSPLSRFAASLDKLEVGATSDARGDVRIDLRNWSPFDALVCANGYAMRAIPVQSDRTRPFVELALEPAGPLFVRVDSAKSLRKDIEVRVSFIRGALFAGAINGKAGQRMHATLKLDEHLETDLSSPPLNSEIDVTACIAPSPPGRKVVTLARGEERTVTFDFSKSVAVHGRVIDSEKRPVADAELWLRRTAPLTDTQETANPETPTPVEPEPEPRATVTDGEGKFRFIEVPPGYWSLGTDPERLAALARAGAPSVAYIEPRRLRLAGDGVAAELDLRAIMGWMVTGRVVDVAGRPVEGATVGDSHRFRPRDAPEGTFSGPDGAFVVDPITSKSIDLVANPYSNRLASSSPVTLTGPTRDLVIVLPFGATIAGQVRAEPGAAGMRICLVGADSSVFARDADDARGSFRFGGLYPQTYWIFAATNDGRLGVSREIEVSKDQSVEDLVVEVSAPGYVDASKVPQNSNGGPAEFVQVAVNGMNVSAIDSMVDSFDGKYQLPTGQVRVWLVPLSQRANGDQEPRLLSEFDLAAGETRALPPNL